MKALINFKICDNSQECSGIEVCPTKAMYFDKKKQRIAVDETKCTSCKACQEACPVGAIMVADNQKQYQQYLLSIENDTRTIKDLFIDRYGAVPLSTFFIIKPKDLANKIKSKDVVLIEIFSDDSIQCLLKSIPIKEIIDNFSNKILFYKLKANANLKLKYKLKKLPTLLIFKDDKLLGKIEGWFSTEQTGFLQTKLKDILSTTERL